MCPSYVVHWIELMFCEKISDPTCKELWFVFNTEFSRKLFTFVGHFASCPFWPKQTCGRQKWSGPNSLTNNSRQPKTVPISRTFHKLSSFSGSVSIFQNFQDVRAQNINCHKPHNPPIVFVSRKLRPCSKLWCFLVVCIPSQPFPVHLSWNPHKDRNEQTEKMWWNKLEE